jgi:hypothetical protein
MEKITKTWQERLASKWWRMNNLYKVKNKQGELVTFKPNEIQYKHVIERGTSRYNLILKARQFGFTTLYCIDLLDESLFNSGTMCGIIAHEAKKLPDYFTIVRRAFINLPEWLKPETKTDTKYMYEFVKAFDGTPLDSGIFVSMNIRGGTVQNLHITESAYISDRIGLKTGSKQAVPITGRISEETTANGYEGFYDDYMFAYNDNQKNEQSYRTYFYPWIASKEYTLTGTLDDETEDEKEIRRIAKETYNVEVTDGQLLWRRWKINEMRSENVGFGLNTKQLFKQEYPLTISEAFQSGAGNVFDMEKVDSIRLGMPITHGDALAWHNKGLKIYKLPEVGKSYVIGCDPSDGVGSDNSCIDIWEVETREQVAQFYGKVRPDELADLITEFATFYNKAYVGVENNMLTTILLLSKQYDNYYSDTKMDERTAKMTRKIGWNTNTKTRDLMIDEFIIAFDEGTLKVNSAITVQEMRTFVKNDVGKREHAEGRHDDSLFAAFIAIQMFKFHKSGARVFSTKPF